MRVAIYHSELGPIEADVTFTLYSSGSVLIEKVTLDLTDDLTKSDRNDLIEAIQDSLKRHENEDHKYDCWKNDQVEKGVS